jgi:hypothetical protein
LVSGNQYGFRIRARNIFGWGPYSAVTYIQAAREPAQPDAPTTSIDPTNGGVVVTWTAPDARGSPIVSYLVEFAKKGSTTIWSVVPTCDGSVATIRDAHTCTVSMDVFQTATFGYGFDDVVYVRVTASNFYLAGVESPACGDTGARIRVVPSQMSPPTEDMTSTDTQLLLHWIPLTGADAGNSAVIAYSLFWDAGDNTKAAADLPLVD